MYHYLLFFLLLFFASCKSVQYVPVERIEVKTEYRDKAIERRDSVFVQDSIFVQLRGDTLYHDRWHIRYRERIRADTLYLVRSDSVLVPQIIEVDKPPSFVETLSQRVAILLCLLALLYLLWHITKRLWRKLP